MASLSGSRIQHCHKLQHQSQPCLRSGVTVVQVTVVASVQPLAQELSYTTVKRKGEKKKKRISSLLVQILCGTLRLVPQYEVCNTNPPNFESSFHIVLGNIVPNQFFFFFFCHLKTALTNPLSKRSNPSFLRRSRHAFCLPALSPSHGYFPEASCHVEFRVKVVAA